MKFSALYKKKHSAKAECCKFPYSLYLYLRAIPESHCHFLIPPNRNEIHHAAPKPFVKFSNDVFLCLQNFNEV